MKYRALLVSPLGFVPGALGSANAADIPAPVTKAPAAVVSRAFSWTGPYAGAHVGYIRQQSDQAAFDPPTGPCWAFDCAFVQKQSAGGFFGGVQLGYNFQSGNWVFGLETDIGWSSARSTSTGIFNGGGSAWTTTIGIEELGTLRGRLGYAWDRAMVYGTGGLAYGNIRNSHQADTGYSWSQPPGWRVGWTAGGGIEYAVDNAWSIKAEALYYDLGTADHTPLDNIGLPWGLRDRTTGVIARAGLNYLFGR